MGGSNGDTSVGDKAAKRLVAAALQSRGVTPENVMIRNGQIHVWVRDPLTADDVHGVLDLEFWIDSGLADRDVVVHLLR